MTAMSVFDSLRGFVNGLSGMGTSRDKGRSGAGQWYFTPLDYQQIEAAYRGNWILRKAIDIPIYDMLREGWTWAGDEDDVSRIEEAQQFHDIHSKIIRAVTSARLFGGSLVLISDGADDPSAPLDWRTIPRGGLNFIHALDRQEIVSGPIDLDPMSRNYLLPTYYSLSSGSRGGLPIHPTRTVRLTGRPLPRRVQINADNWGDSYMESIYQAVIDATQAQSGIAQLVQEAAVDVFKIKGFTQKVTQKQFRDAWIERVQLASQTKSIVNALVMDAEEDYEQKTANFAQLPDVQRLLLQIASGAADVPITRFLGQAPAGLNATGESDMRNYYDRLRGDQELLLRPALTEVLRPVVMDALGEWPEGLTFSFNPLWQMSEKEKADIELAAAKAVQVYDTLGLVPESVLRQGVRNRLSEIQWLPGIDAAYGEAEKEGDDFDELERQNPASENEPPDDLGAPMRVIGDQSFDIPEAVRREARRGLDWVEEHGRGSTRVGRAMAERLARGGSVDEATVRKIAMYFPRHEEASKGAEGFRPGEDGYPSAGRIAWANWGGDAGRAWAERIVERLDREDDDE